MIEKHYERSVFLMREAIAKYKNVAMLFAGGKDSMVMLDIAHGSLFNKMPKVIFLDTTFAFRETKEFLRRVSETYNIDIIYAQNRDALIDGVSPINSSHMECCTKLKTDALHKCIIDNKFDAVMLAIRWDEHYVRNKETFFSQRDTPKHIRVHPMLHWSEKDIWSYIRKYGIMYNPLYDYNIDGKHYYSLGCYPCTKPITEDEHKCLGERGGRSLDKERIMEKLKALGYMG